MSFAASIDALVKMFLIVMKVPKIKNLVNTTQTVKKKKKPFLV